MAPWTTGLRKILHTKMEQKGPRGRPQTRLTDQIRKDIEMRGRNWEEIQEIGENRRLDISL